MSVTIMIDGCIKRNRKFLFQLQSSRVGFEPVTTKVFASSFCFSGCLTVVLSAFLFGLKEHLGKAFTDNRFVF